MELSTDSKHLKIHLNDIERQLLYNRIIKRYGYTPTKQYGFVVRDKRNGVFLCHFPKAPYMNYTTSLIFQGYSNNSHLLRDIFDLISLHRWKIRRIDIALDTNLQYEHVHAVHPPTKATVERYRSSMYLGSHSSPVQLHAYNKQEQMRHQWGIHTDTWTRVELRFRFEPMIQMSKLSIDDFTAAARYQIITNTCMMPEKLRNNVDLLRKGKSGGGKEWSELTRTNQREIRAYGYEHGVNMLDLISSNLEGSSMDSFIYAPMKKSDELSS